MGGSQSTTAASGEQDATASTENVKSLATSLQKSRAKRLSEVLRGARHSSDSTDSGAKSADPSTERPVFPREVDEVASQVNPEDYDFLFENLVFEGGGNKGLATCGAVKYLEELGILSKVHRYAGTSAGALMAGLLASGYTAREVEPLLNERMDKIFLDAGWGWLSLIPNVLRTYGWHPGQRFFDWYGNLLKDKLGDANVTFLQLYRKTGRELCIVVTNLTQMTTHFCHPKTTPDMPVRMAIRMSMSIPGLFSAVKYMFTDTDEVEDVNVDGGLMCNYAIHCFDGWYLSMKPEDSFIRRLQPLYDIPLLMERSNRFEPYNHKTLGMLLYSEGEDDILKMRLERRVGCRQPAEPAENTKLFLERKEEMEMKHQAEKEHYRVVKAIDAFLAVLKKYTDDQDNVIDRKELEAAFQDEAVFPPEQAEVLFGKDVSVSQVFALLDHDGNGKIRYDELTRFIEKSGVDLQALFLGYRRQTITGLFSYMSTLQNTITHNVQKLYVEERDLDRTVGINTGHVGTTDFVLENADVQFMVQRGYNSMKAFLQYYVAKHPDKVRKKSASPPSSTPDKT